MHYENHLRIDSARDKGYNFTLKDIEKPQIEHIAPQTENDKKIASGYCKYDKEFYDDGYLHRIGNLVLISAAHNGSIGNKPFSEKLESYKESPLSQQREIKDFVVNNGIWDKDSIQKRHEAIESFVLSHWSFD